MFIKRDSVKKKKRNMQPRKKKKYVPKKSVEGQELPAKFVGGFLANMDGRTDLAKRLNLTYDAVLEDAGGPSMPIARIILCERFCFLEELLRQIEVTLVKDPPAAIEMIGKYSMALNCMTNLIRLLGIGDRFIDKSKELEILYGEDPESDET